MRIVQMYMHEGLDGKEIVTKCIQHFIFESSTAILCPQLYYVLFMKLKVLLFGWRARWLHLFRALCSIKTISKSKDNSKQNSSQINWSKCFHLPEIWQKTVSMYFSEIWIGPDALWQKISSELFRNFLLFKHERLLTLPSPLLCVIFNTYNFLWDLFRPFA